MRQNFSGRVSFQIQKLGRSVKQNGNVYCRAKGYSNTRRSEKYFHFTIYFERQSGNIAVQVCIQVESRQTPVDDTHKSKREVYKDSSIAHKLMCILQAPEVQNSVAARFASSAPPLGALEFYCSEKNAPACGYQRVCRET